jgi:hypothetical protein
MGIRPTVARQVVRTFVYVHAAVYMALGKMTTLILPHANTATMNLFLEEVSHDFKEYFVIMVVDGVGWHRSQELRIPENIRLIQQQPHGPELNPVGHALCKGLRELYDDPGRVKSITNFPYLEVTY